MSEWPDQISEFQRNWVEQQQKLLSDWLDSMQGAGGSSARASWREAADVMERQIDSALEAQKQSLRAFAENLEKVEGAPDAFGDAVKQLEDGIDQWAEVQQRMWRVWFDMLRAAAPMPQTPGEAMMESWEDMVKRTMSIQEEWLSKLSGPPSSPGGTSKSKAGSPSSSGSTSKKKTKRSS